ncbi:MAG: hypothetical protein ACLUIQ_09570 [Dialister invisus]
MGKTGNGTMTRSEESITLDDVYRLLPRAQILLHIVQMTPRSPSFSTLADGSQLTAHS